MSAVTTQGSEYELVLMLDPEAPDERRDQIAAEALRRIEAGGDLKHDRAWGMRKLAYEIRQRTEADYRFFRFEAESALLDDLDHNLKITDGVLRFRIFRVDPDSPVIEPPPPVALAASSSGRGPGGRRGAASEPRPRPGAKDRDGGRISEPPEDSGAEGSGEAGTADEAGTAGDAETAGDAGARPEPPEAPDEPEAG